MQGIEGSSRRIAEIAGAIDGIACQTNILALNAAVEDGLVGRFRLSRDDLAAGPAVRS
jgi:methyl-accepting chemotaxis protein